MHSFESFLCLFRDDIQMHINVIQTCLTVSQWDIGQINIYRITWQVLQEKIDCSTTMYGKHLLFHHYRNKTEQQFYFLSVNT